MYAIDLLGSNMVHHCKNLIMLDYYHIIIGVPKIYISVAKNV